VEVANRLIEAGASVDLQNKVRRGATGGMQGAGRAGRRGRGLILPLLVVGCEILVVVRF
jgi:hypothetical protein